VSLLSIGAIPLLFPFPLLRIGIPDAVGEQPIQIGKVGIVVDEEAQAFAILLARPLAGRYLPSRIIAVEVRTAERRPPAVRTTFNIAAVAMAFTDRRATIAYVCFFQIDLDRTFLSIVSAELRMA
jgi:hypothetical protein